MLHEHPFRLLPVWPSKVSRRVEVGVPASEALATMASANMLFSLLQAGNFWPADRLYIIRILSFEERIPIRLAAEYMKPVSDDDEVVDDPLFGVEFSSFSHDDVLHAVEWLRVCLVRP